MPPGWGKRATGKVDRKLEDDELFKAIGGQLDPNNFDYSQWQRSGEKKAPPSRGARKPPTGPRKDTPERPTTGRITGFTVSSGAGTWMRGASADTCKHGHGRTKVLSKKDQTIDNSREKKKAEQIKILQLRIRTRRQTLEDYKKREAQLLIDNMKMKEVIDSEEADSHVGVKKLLRKYEKFRGGIITLNDKFHDEHAKVNKELEQTQVKIAIDIAGLQRQVDNVDAKLQERLSELNILMTYKDKEYPVKALRISELKKEIDSLKYAHKDEESELQHIVENEIDKFKKEQSSTKHDITEKVTEEAISLMHPSLKDMALQNLVMEKELEFHTKEIEELREDNKLLDIEVKALLKDPKTSIRQQMFPEFYPNREKCTPEMEVVLDIPTHEWLPI